MKKPCKYCKREFDKKSLKIHQKHCKKRQDANRNLFKNLPPFTLSPSYDYMSDEASQEFGISISKEVELPDILEVIKNQFTCPECNLQLFPKDPVAHLKILETEHGKNLFCQSNPISLYNHLVTILRDSIRQLKRNELPDNFILQCDACPYATNIKTQSLADFIVKETILHDGWSNDFRLVLKQNKLMFA